MNVIEISNLHKKFGNFTALKNINLTIKKGELFGCIGPNGAGKTTLVKILTGQLEPTGGKISVLGIDPSRSPLEVKKKVGIVPEAETLPSYLTSYEYLYLVGRIRNVSSLDQTIKDWFRFFDIDMKEKSLCKDLSRGSRQKLVIAAALMHQPELLFLDEPLVNLDPIYQRRLKDYLTNYVARGNTIFMCSHLLEIAEKICTKIAIINHGEIIASGRIDELKKYSDDSLENIFLRSVQEI